MTELEELLNLFSDSVLIVNPRYWKEAHAYIAEEYQHDKQGRRNSIIIEDYYPTMLQDDDGERVYLGFREADKQEEGIR